jgi:uncharacterized membrane protein
MIHSMKLMLFGLLALLPLLTAAQRKPAPTKLVNCKGVITVVVISRGAYQFLLTDHATQARYVITNFPDSLQQVALDAQKPMAVICSGTLQAGSTPLYNIGANDVPVATQTKLRNIQLTAIRRG